MVIKDIKKIAEYLKRTNDPKLIASIRNMVEHGCDGRSLSRVDCDFNKCKFNEINVCIKPAVQVNSDGRCKYAIMVLTDIAKEIEDFEADTDLNPELDTTKWMDAEKGESHE